MNPDSDKAVRRAAWAGAFYPDNPGELSQMIRQYVSAAKVEPISGRLLGLVVPHAGYIYSGPTAAHGYKLLQEQTLHTVFVLAPSHAEWFSGVAIYNGDYYETPLGRVAIDRDKSRAMTEGQELIRLSTSGHKASGDRAEHSLEVQLPFLQTVLTRPFKLVAAVFHDYSMPVCKALGSAIAGVMQDSDIIIASTDLFHGYSYSACKRTDEKTVQAIQSLDVDDFCLGSQKEIYQACGAGPVAALLYAAKEKGADTVRLLHQTNSADVTGSQGGWTVGYACLSVHRCKNA